MESPQHHHGETNKGQPESAAATEIHDKRLDRAVEALRGEFVQLIDEHCDDMQKCPPNWHPDDWRELVLNRVLLDLVNATRQLLPELLIRGRFASGAYIWDRQQLEQLTERARIIIPMPGNLLLDQWDAEARRDESPDSRKT